jgi:hypothetical protein
LDRSSIALPLINLSLLLSQRLLSQSRRQRSLNAEDVAIEVIDEHLKSGLCLDDTEMPFDSMPRLNPPGFPPGHLPGGKSLGSKLPPVEKAV